MLFLNELRLFGLNSFHLLNLFYCCCCFVVVAVVVVVVNDVVVVVVVVGPTVSVRVLWIHCRLSVSQSVSQSVCSEFFSELDH